MTGPTRRARWRLEAAAVRAGLALLRRLGPVAASNLGGAVARGIGPLLPVSRVARANLRRALPALDAAERARILRGVWDNLGRTVGELPHLPRLRATVSGPGWTVEGQDTIAALARGGRAILVSGHIGNWEVLARVAAASGIPFAGFYRAASNPLVDDVLQALRAEAAGSGMPAFPKGAIGARGALAYLRDGGRLAMLVDQKMNDGIEASFFGHPAMTAPAAAALALRFGCPIVPAYVRRIGPARFRVVCETPVPLPSTGNRQRDIATLTQTLNDRLEAWIRACPEQWLWLHRRWPR